MEFIKDLDYIIIRILSEWKWNNGLGNEYDFSKRMETDDDDLILQRLKLKFQVQNRAKQS